MKQLEQRISNEREELNFTRSDLASATGISISYISSLENGIGSELNIQTIDKIAQSLGLNIDELLRDSLEYYNSPNISKKIFDILELMNEDQLKLYSELLMDYGKRK